MTQRKECVVNWKFKEGAKPQGSSDGFWYDITNGYIEPELLLANAEQLKQLNAAIELVRSFEAAMEKVELLNEF